MNVCRICLSNDSHKDICDLKVLKNGKTDSYINIMQFCFDIKIVRGSEISKKLCLKCYKKVLMFHDFKTLALKSDTYLKTLDAGYIDEVFVDDLDIKVEKESIDIALDLGDIKGESCIKTEEVSDQSDNECLSIIKAIKYELVEEETKENAPVKKKIGRPKLLRKAKAEKQDHVCEECGITVKNLKIHMHQHQPVNGHKRYKCEVCDKTFSSYSSRHKHNKRKHLGIKEQCKICDKYIFNLAYHTRTMHNKEKLPFKCVLCGRRFIYQSQLDRHLVLHTKSRPYACDLCDKKFSGYTNLAMHKRQVHDKEKMHLCQYCSKSFFKKYHLQVHLRTHTKEKPYKCPECNKSFASSTTLRNHQLTHKGDKKFECTMCPMTFIRKGYLRNHMISHTKEKRYECQYCGVRFGRSDHRKRHEYTAHQRHLLPTTLNTV